MLLPMPTKIATEWSLGCLKSLLSAMLPTAGWPFSASPTELLQ
jgi:hypothetical protein